MTQDCGLIDLLEPGDVVMADKGFDIQHLLAPKKAILNIPPFMGGKEQLTLQEEADTRRIASVRIHVERAIELSCATGSYTHIYSCTVGSDLVYLLYVY